MPTTLVKLSGVIYLKGVLSSPDSAFEDARMGVAVILQQRLQASEVVVGEIYKGFLMSVDFVSNQQKIYIIHVYCPSYSSERVLFLNKLAEYIDTVDFNKFVMYL